MRLRSVVLCVVVTLLVAVTGSQQKAYGQSNPSPKPKAAMAGTAQFHVLNVGAKPDASQAAGAKCPGGLKGTVTVVSEKAGPMSTNGQPASGISSFTMTCQLDGTGGDAKCKETWISRMTGDGVSLKQSSSGDIGVLIRADIIGGKTEVHIGMFTIKETATLDSPLGTSTKTGDLQFLGWDAEGRAASADSSSDSWLDGAGTTITWNLSGASCAGEQTPAGDAGLKAPAAGIQARPIPAESLRRFEQLYAALQPSARTWVDQQASIEAQRPNPDLGALRAAVRQRFASSLSATGPGRAGSSAGPLNAGTVDAIVWLILVQSYQEQQRGLQSRAERTQLYNHLENEIRNVLTGMEQESAAAKPSQRSATCTTAFCLSLPSRLAEINAASAKTSHPTNLQAPANVTYTQLSALQNEAYQALNNLDAEEQYLALQENMQDESRTFSLMSNMEKSMSDQASNVIGNLR